MENLFRWGLVPRILAELSLSEVERRAFGRVVFTSHNHLEVVTEDGVAPARLRGRVREDPPVVGDWVATDVVSNTVVAERVLPRATAFTRRSPDGERQIIASNLDVVLVACPLDLAPNLRRIERYLAVAHGSGAEPIVVLTKRDLVPDPGAAVDAVRKVAGNVLVLAVSATTGAGLDALREHLPIARTAALLGTSGAGKSTLVNALVGAEVQRTQAVRERDHRGRHTTTANRLLMAPDGRLWLDTPGLRELQPYEDAASLDDVFADIEAFAADCRFRDCHHDGEPGCRIGEALAKGELDPGRWGSWQKLQRELAHEARRMDARLQAEEKQRWKKIHMDARRRDAEKHR